MVETVVNVERTTTTTTNGPPGGPSSGDGGFWSAIRLNIDYFRTLPGIIKIVEFELITTAVLTLLYFIAFIVQLARWSGVRGQGQRLQHGRRRLWAVQLLGLCGGHVLPVPRPQIGSYPLVWTELELELELKLELGAPAGRKGRMGRMDLARDLESSGSRSSVE
ncbi:GL14986 [Drosophila persimilis]|uniref:GL14986 n=1 Tax=Drosophila persimilis TaxID=7234 RepID=B4H0F9_DROPE|nr:GL14986 [Drosophila persimilis]